MSVLSDEQLRGLYNLVYAMHNNPCKPPDDYVIDAYNTLIDEVIKRIHAKRKYGRVFDQLVTNGPNTNPFVNLAILAAVVKTQVFILLKITCFNDIGACAQSRNGGLTFLLLGRLRELRAFLNGPNTRDAVFHSSVESMFTLCLHYLSNCTTCNIRLST